MHRPFLFMKTRIVSSQSCRVLTPVKPLVGAMLFVIAAGLPHNVRAEDNFRSARILTYRSAVIWHADGTEKQLQTFPSPQEFLAILARASVPERNALIRKPHTEHLRVEATIDGISRIFVLPLPAPDGSEPYAFFAHPGKKGEVPQLVLSAEDAKSLGLLLRNFK